MLHLAVVLLPCSMALQVPLFAVCHHKIDLAPGYSIKGLMIPDTAEVLV